MFTVYPTISYAKVVPLAGTWIEIDAAGQTLAEWIVVPLAGTWIEIRRSASDKAIDKSYLSQVRGLK